MRLWVVLASLVVAAAADEQARVKAFGRCDAPTPSKEASCDKVPEIMELQTTECRKYHILVSRGTDEVAPGRLGNLTQLICNKFGGKKSCGWESVDYPAKNRFLSDTTWCESADIGVRNGQKQIREYVDKCPKTKMILIGYSQGASITQDMLAGGGGPIFKCTQETSPPFDRTTAPGKNSKFVASAVWPTKLIMLSVAAAVTFGTVRRVPGASYAVKSGKDKKSEGIRTDEQRAELDKWADALRDYCHDGDPICASSSEHPDLQHHLTYMSLYTEEIVDWVVDTVKKSTRQSGRPLLHQLSQDGIWLTSALMFSLGLSWTALFCYTSLRRKLARGF